MTQTMMIALFAATGLFLQFLAMAVQWQSMRAFDEEDHKLARIKPVLDEMENGIKTAQLHLDGAAGDLAKEFRDVLLQASVDQSREFRSYEDQIRAARALRQRNIQLSWAMLLIGCILQFIAALLGIRIIAAALGIS